MRFTLEIVLVVVLGVSLWAFFTVVPYMPYDLAFKILENGVALVILALVLVPVVLYCIRS